MPDEVILTVGGLDYGGWTSVEVLRSLDEISGSFNVHMTEKWPGQQAARAIQPGDFVRVAIGGETVITGWVDDVNPTYDATSHEVEIRGRDATGDLVDCSAILAGSGMRLAPTFLGIAQELVAPFGITVRADVDVATSMYAFTLQIGETVFDAIDRLCRYHGVLPTSDGQGGILFTRAGTGGSVARIALGSNIEKAEGAYSMRQRYSVYYVLGQAGGTDFIPPEVTVGAKGVATDPGVARYRPLIVTAEMPDINGNYAKRAQWEANVRRGRARQARLTVNGWRDANGTLYRPNTMVQVDDDFLGIHDEILIAGVKLTLDDQGRRAELAVTRREAFDVIAMPDEGWFDVGAQPGTSSGGGATDPAPASAGGAANPNGAVPDDWQKQLTPPPPFGDSP